MKKRIVALLLAGLMTTATLASCVVQNSDDPHKTEPNQNPPTNQTTPDPGVNNNPPVVTWQDVDKTVYTVKDVTLRKEANGTSTALASISKETALHCTKQSTSWLYVEYEKDGETLQGYITKTSLTEINILATDFVEIEGGSKIMYANAKTINVRLYPTDAEFSSSVGTFSLNDEVTVYATNGTWYQVKYVKNGEEKKYFVSASCLSNAKVTDPDDDTPYRDLFTAVNGEEGVTKYVSVEKDGKVNFRVAPLIHKDTDIIMSLSNGCKVTLLKTGTVDGMAWSYVAVYVTSDKDGVPSEYKYGYISSAYLSDMSGEMTLDELIEHHGFTKIEGGMMYYVLKGATINIRSTPDFPDTAAGEADNLLTSPQSGTTAESIKALKVVATGKVGDTTWFMVEYTKKDGENETIVRGFVGGKALEQLTTDEGGERIVTIEELKTKYPQLTILETPETKTANKAANCYGTPDTTGTVLGKIDAGATVTVVAKETGSRATWCVIQTAEGKLFFVGIEFFN